MFSSQSQSTQIPGIDEDHENPVPQKISTIITTNPTPPTKGIPMDSSTNTKEKPKERDYEEIKIRVVDEEDHEVVDDSMSGTLLSGSNAGARDTILFQNNPYPKPPLRPSKPNFADDISFDADAENEFGPGNAIQNTGFYKHHPRLRYFNATPYPPPKLQNQKFPKKRGHDRDGDELVNQTKKIRFGPASTPCSVLNEMSPGITYAFSDNLGSPHEASFEATVIYPGNGKEYKTRAKSKKQAKQAVAELILKDLGVPIPEVQVSEEPASPMETTPSPSQSKLPVCLEPFPLPTIPQVPNELFNMDFASDDIPTISIPSAATPSYLSPSIINRIRKIDLQETSTSALHALLAPAGSGKAALKYEVVGEEGSDHEKCFTIRVSFVDLIKSRNNQRTGKLFFFGKGCSKRQAKNDASQQALIFLLGEDYYRNIVDYQKRMKASNKDLYCEKVNKAKDQLMENEGNEPENSEYNTQFSDYISRLVTDKYEEIMQSDPKHLAHKVIAGIVMSMGSPMIENCVVVAITTGTKCIEGDYISDEGLAVNDCHAEILAVRCLREFLYTQIDRIRDYENSMDLPFGELSGSQVLERCGSIEDGKFKLKEGIKFHLYINTSPCGDARIFSPKGLDLEECSEALTPPGDEASDIHPNRNNRGVLRAKIEAGEGTLPVINHTGGVQTWDGILQGNALRTMSCSDKICRWNVIGVQGALLSNLINPIYLSSIVLGSLHHPAHLKRAMYGRLEGLKELPAPYKLNRLKLLMVPCPEKRKVKKSPNHAIAWTCTWNVAEVLAATKGKCDIANTVSRLAKRIAFIRFLKIYKNESGKRDDYINISYDSAKHLAGDFQEAKKKFEDYMEESGNGKWISKPFEQDNFAIQ